MRARRHQNRCRWPDLRPGDGSAVRRADSSRHRDAAGRCTLLVLVALMARRGSLTALLCLLGILAFMTYNYVIFGFSIHFGPLFLVWGRRSRPVDLHSRRRTGERGHVGDQASVRRPADDWD